MRKSVDERVQQESYRVMAKNFRNALLLLLLLLVIKVAGMLLGLPWYVLLPEAGGILAGTAVWAVWMSLRGLWGPEDERTGKEKEVCLSTSWTVMHCTALLICAVMMFLDDAGSTVYILTGLAMTMITFATMGRMTRQGLYMAPRGQSPWPRVLGITGLTLVLSPALMRLMGAVRQETYPLWMYVLLEAILLASCLLGGLLAASMMKRSAVNAENQLKAAEEEHEE